MSATIINLPFPPTTNSLFANVPGRGRVRTQRYRTWAVAAGWDLKAQQPQSIEGDFILEIILGRPDKRRRDASNFIKAVEDLLVEHRIVEDDCLAQKVSIAWGDVQGCQAIVRAA
jgi:crossover junction endodeoxyribonuclease RusA